MPTPSSTDHERDRPADPARRRLFALGAGATAASVAAVATAQQYESPEEQIDRRYSRTPHVERYYALNRL
jgi:hypothetical protein|tara:strand:- start:1916 stop:2125 length:210 start_codon:yes stop_codon:yes gene_type:complete